MRRLIGLCGWARVGKDALCAELGFQRAAFADALKSDLAPLLAKLPPHEKEHIRPLLVEYGRTARRIDPDYWISRIVLPMDGDVCATDLRYINEARYILDQGGIVIRLHRPGIGPANDEERDSINAIDAKFHFPSVTNDGPIEQTASRVRELLYRKAA